MPRSRVTVLGEVGESLRDARQHDPPDEPQQGSDKRLELRWGEFCGETSGKSEQRHGGATVHRQQDLDSGLPMAVRVGVEHVR